MLSYTSRRALFGNLVNNSDTTILAVADTLMNDRTRFILTTKPWWFLEKVFTLTTVASKQFLPLPGGIDRIISSPYLTVGSFRRVPKECPSREEWDKLNSYTPISDFPVWWYEYAGQLGFWPKPATAGNIITINAKPRIVDLSRADYTTGTIVTTSNAGLTFTVTIASPGVFSLTSHGFIIGQELVFSTTGALPTGLVTGTAYYVVAAGLTANAFQVSTTVGGTAVNTSGTQSGTHSISTPSTTVTGSGTTWSTAFIGWYIRIDSSATATNAGDDVWYQISGVPSSTTLTLNGVYGGAPITAGSATYTIGQMSLLPEAYDSLPIYLSLQAYFASIDPADSRSAMYAGMAKDLFTQMNQEQSNRTGGRVLDSGMDDDRIINPNLTVQA